jgi:Zn-dependent protease with chaperone function
VVGAITLTSQNLTGLRPQAYEHPSDRVALDALQRTIGLEKIVGKLSEWGFERLLRVELTGSYLRATPDSFPELDEVLTTACKTLDLPSKPDLYIAGGSQIDALTAGVEHPLIVLFSAAVELLTPEELLFVIAREVGHIKSSHVLYRQIARFLPVVAEIVEAMTLGAGMMLSVGVQIALMRWQRMSEFTADRAGLLGCQNTDIALRTMMKLAGLPSKYFHAINPEDFIKQAKEFQAMDADKLTLLAKWMSTVGETRPWTVMRAQQLLQWVDTGGYADVLRAPQRIPYQPPAGVRGFCNQCGLPLKGTERFCPGCGQTLLQTQAANH